MRRAWIVSTAFLLLSCSPGDSSSDGGPDALPPCELSATVEEGPPFPSPRSEHATYLATEDGRTLLRVVGGINEDGVLASTFEAEVLPDGTLGEWREGIPLPEGRYGHTLAVVHGRAYLISGRTHNRFLGPTLVSVHDERGRLTGWEIPLIRSEGEGEVKYGFHATAAVWGDRIYYGGGLDAGYLAINAMSVLEVDKDGSITSWRPLEGPQYSRALHRAEAINGHLYLFYGLSGDVREWVTAPRPEIVRAPIQADGDLGEWQTVHERGEGHFYDFGSVSFDNCVVLVGGIHEPEDGGIATATDEILFGTPGAAMEMTALNARLTDGRGRLGRLAWRSPALYVVSGVGYGGRTPAVDIIRFE